MELTLDIFKNDAFSVQSLRRVVDNTPFIPTMLGDMRIFNDQPIITKEVLLYEEDGNIRIIPVTERGAPEAQQVRDAGRLRALSTSRLAKKDTVRAGELMGVANQAFPERIRLRNATDLVNRRTSQLKSDLEMTKELHRLGALQGKLVTTRLDGTSYVVNFFTEYGIAEPTPIEIDFANTSEDDLMMDLQNTFLKPMRLSLKNRWTPQTRIVALVGDSFWDSLMRHPAIKEIYKLQQQGAMLALASNPLAIPNLWGEITYAGITWINYQGSTNDEIAVPDDQAVFFPVGARDVFDVYWAPGETFDDIQEPGRPEYLYVEPDQRQQLADHVDIILRAYPLYACIYPQCLMKGILP